MGGVGRAPGQGAHPQHKFWEMERFAEVIVRSEPRPVRGHRVFQRQSDQHHHGVVALGDSPADHVAVHAGEILSKMTTS